MEGHSPVDSDFLNRVNSAIAENISNEQFGVSELADAMGMSRSNLLRKVKSLTRLSVSQLIRQERLKKSMELLRSSSANVSEVAYQVGFGSPSYFIKCFREYYGYPPGEVGNREAVGMADDPAVPVKRNYARITIGLVGLLGILGVVLITWLQRDAAPVPPLEKSIAVLPFKNESNDSTNIYLINGLMESTLNNLQKIADLRVISRTSSEKYRNTTKSIPEMAKELNVNYFVEGSGQKIGDKILLNIQLIDATTDKHLWGQQYRRETSDIFELQQEIAKNIAKEIEAIVTPEEAERIEKVPTRNLEAYDQYLKGLDLLTRRRTEDMDSALAYFKAAWALDDKFALAYANTAITYYHLDLFHAEKQYTDQIDLYADKALLHDPMLPESLIAKALFFLHTRQYKQAEAYLEKALEYNPNSVFVIYMLSDFYATFSPNTAKYLEYALKGIQMDAAAKDSVTNSYFYLHLSNALIQSGFEQEAIRYINKSLSFFPESPYASYVKAFIMYAQHGDLNITKADLLRELEKDTTRIDILQDVAKVCYYMGDYQAAHKYYSKLIAFRQSHGSNIYQHENSKIALVFAKLGMEKESREYLASYRDFLETDQSIYRSLGLASYHAYLGDTAKALELMEEFTQQDYVQYWVILFLEDEPAMEGIKHLPEFKKLMSDIKARFWANHEELRGTLEDKGLL